MTSTSKYSALLPLTNWRAVPSLGYYYGAAPVRWSVVAESKGQLVIIHRDTPSEAAAQNMAANEIMP